MTMATVTIRNLDDGTKQALRIRAATRGASMEDEARSILRAVVAANLSLDEIASKGAKPKEGNPWERILALREKYGTFEIELPKREGFAGERPIFEDS
jgi:antitoxin FitA